MFIQIHMLQSMPPGNLNRDETGQPKRCIFGGVTRGRISSQCLKRNIRRSAEFAKAFGDALADRTTYLPRMVADELRRDTELGVPEAELRDLMVAIARRFKKEAKDDSSEGAAAGAEAGASDEEDVGQTGQLVFFQQSFARRIAELLARFRKENGAAYLLLRTGELDESEETKARRKTRLQELTANQKLLKQDKKVAATDEAKVAINNREGELQREKDQLKRESDQGKEASEKKIATLISEIATASKLITVDIGLFGRMTTSDLVVNVEATCQVAHAISTHETIIESDYFTAMDECKVRYAVGQMGNAGAAFLGSGETETFFNASVYYKYLNLDLSALRKHLPSLTDEEAAKAVGVLVSAAALATPTGKQNSFASHGIPELLLVEVSNTKRPITYANAFLQPVEGPNYMAQSAKAIKEYVESVAPAFAPVDMQRFLLAVGNAKCTIAKAAALATLDSLAEAVAKAAITTKECAAA
jgi:CRISPR system Cascade subunit CasC